MPRFRLNLNECGSVTQDEDGQVFDDAAAARAGALDAAREIMCGEIREGRLCLSCSIIIADEQGREIYRVWFRDAVAVTGLQSAER